MPAVLEKTPMAKKKSETRRHSAMVRIDAETLDRAKIAASMTRQTLSDYVTSVVKVASDRDIAREAKKLSGRDAGDKP